MPRNMAGMDIALMMTWLIAPTAVHKMYGKPSGMVRLNHEGLPCKLSYDGKILDVVCFNILANIVGDSFQSRFRVEST